MPVLALLVGTLAGDAAGGTGDYRSVTAGLVEVYGVNRIGREYPIAAGFVVNDNGFVATVGQKALKNAPEVVVAPLLWSGQTFEATQREYHPSLELTLLHVPGLRGQALTLNNARDKGQPVLVPLNKDDEFAWSQGAIIEFIERPVQAYGGAAQRFITHNTDLYSPAAYGTPLLNEQGQVIGVNHRNPDVPEDALARKTKPSGNTFAVPSADLAAFLESRNIVFESGVPQRPSEAGRDSVSGTAASPSSPEEVAEIQAEVAEAHARLEDERKARMEAEGEALAARQKANEMARLAEEAESKTSLSEQEKEAARRAARSAGAAAEAAEALAEEATARALGAERFAKDMEEKAAAAVAARDAADQEAQAAQRNLYIAGIAGAVVVLILTLWFYFHSRRSAVRVGQAEARAVGAEEDAQRAQAVAAQAVRPAPFSCLMTGRTPEGRRYALKIPASALGASEGVVIGRNPEHAVVVVDHKAISRQHAKLSLTDDVLHIEDLNSTNGSFVNDERLASSQRMPLRDGSTVRLGPIPFKLKLS